MGERIALGDEVIDTVSGFKGIAIGRYEFLHGCTRIGVQPRVRKGVLADTKTFDEPQLRIVTAGKVAPSPVAAGQRTGGPAPHEPDARTSPTR